MRRVLIGTPCYDGRLDVWYTNSLVNTIKLAIEQEIEIIPIWVSFDALLQRARNDTIKIALDSDVDDLIWIDSDIEWQPEWFFTLLNYSEDVVGATYPKKGDIEEYVIRQFVKRPPIANRLIEVDGLGTGFVKMSRAVLDYLWNSSEMYIDPKDNEERRMICDVAIKNQSLHSEDIHMFDKIREGGFKIYLDPTMTCNHIGSKKYTGDFAKWYTSQFSTIRPRRQL